METVVSIEDRFSMLLSWFRSAVWRQCRRALHLEIQTQSDRLLRQFYDMPFVGINERLPHSDHWVRVNDRMCQIFGYSRKELLQMTW